LNQTDEARRIATLRNYFRNVAMRFTQVMASHFRFNPTPGISLRYGELTLAGPASACAHDNDRLRLPSVSPAQNSETEKKHRRSTASADFASRAASHPRTYRPATKAALSALPKMDSQQAAA
jgi:hypothetical protein